MRAGGPWLRVQVLLAAGFCWRNERPRRGGEPGPVQATAVGSILSRRQPGRAGARAWHVRRVPMPLVALPAAGSRSRGVARCVRSWPAASRHPRWWLPSQRCRDRCGACGAPSASGPCWRHGRDQGSSSACPSRARGAPLQGQGLATGKTIGIKAQRARPCRFTSLPPASPVRPASPSGVRPGCR